MRLSEFPDRRRPLLSTGCSTPVTRMEGAAAPSSISDL